MVRLLSYTPGRTRKTRKWPTSSPRRELNSKGKYDGAGEQGLRPRTNGGGIAPMARSLCTTILLLLCLAGTSAGIPADEFLAICADRSPEAVAKAIEEGADVNVRNNKGQTALMIAAENNENAGVIEVLLERGADADADSDWTVLMYAAQQNKNPDVVRALLKGGADVDSTTGGLTALIRAAAWNQNPQVVKALLDAGADVADRDESGVTVLMYAATYQEKSDGLRMLIAAGADVDARDGDGWTALMWAARHNHVPAAMEALLQAGATSSSRTRRGRQLSTSPRRRRTKVP
ncbi:ankyrin repeat domain-containing protein [Aminivibrio sp.]|uniref:ankyrin repeat domain-containing protein n=1 Tax=Aminivibrio sp. TaxID=1872489 RepID=UPI00345EEF15